MRSEVNFRLDTSAQAHHVSLSGRRRNKHKRLSSGLHMSLLHCTVRKTLTLNTDYNNSSPEKFVFVPNVWMRVFGLLRKHPGLFVHHITFLCQVLLVAIFLEEQGSFPRDSRGSWKRGYEVEAYLFRFHCIPLRKRNRTYVLFWFLLCLHIEAVLQQ